MECESCPLLGGNLSLLLKTYLWPISVALLMSGRVTQKRRLCSLEEPIERPFRLGAERAVSWAQLLARPREPCTLSSGRGPVHRGGDAGPGGCGSRSPQAAPVGRGHHCRPQPDPGRFPRKWNPFVTCCFFQCISSFADQIPCSHVVPGPEGQWRLSRARCPPPAPPLGGS